MRTSALAACLAAAGLALGCGGKQAPEPHYDVHSHGVGEKHDIEEEHHGVGIAEIDGFHDQLDPLVHAPAGDQRKADTCKAAGSMKDDAFQIVGRARADHAAWEGNANALVQAVDALGAACTGGGDVDKALAGVHDAFHGLIEQVMGTDADHANVGH